MAWAQAGQVKASYGSGGGRGKGRSGSLADCLPWGRQKFVALVCIVSGFQAYAKVKIGTGAPGNFIKSARNNNNKDHNNNGLKK